MLGFLKQVPQQKLEGSLAAAVVLTAWRVTVIFPKDLDSKSHKDFSKVVDKIRERKFGEALKKLTDFERKYDSTPETAHLRAQLEAIPWSDEDDD